jgi:hypothetical protein
VNDKQDDKPLRGFGFTMSIPAGGVRGWYVDKEGIQRWADNDEPVPCYTVTEAGRAQVKS